MEWAHDLGGRPGFGAVDAEPDEPAFHAPWERTARALVYAVMMHCDNASTSMFRHSMERMDPEHYLTSSYYEHWFTAAATLAVESGIADLSELAERAGGPIPIARPVADVVAERTGQLRFAVGDIVRVRDIEPTGHTRVPGYLRGHVGSVTHLLGSFNLPDVEAHSTDRVMEATYSVRFSGQELWGTDDGANVNVGLWDSYLEAV